MAADKQDNPPVARAGRPCPICGKASVTAFRPFCSKRCADIDLHRWLGGVYAVPDDAGPEVGAGDSDA
jgi:endogenous inhibitor of DNA gyrase (YacG/DUF329 family)